MHLRGLVRALIIAAISLAAASLIPAAASADTKVVNFDDRSQDERVSTQYQTSAGVHFVESNGALEPLVKSAPSLAHSANNVAIYSCENLPGCGEGFPPPRLRGVLDNSAASVSAYVGFYAYSPPGSGATAEVQIRAYNASDELVGQSPYVTVTENAAFNQQLTATAASGKVIDYFEVVADKPGDGGKSVGIDDLSITTAAPQPPNFTLNQGSQGVVDVLTGTSVDVPISLNRLNASNGDISFAVTGLPKGMTANFNPNPVTGAGTSTTMTLTAQQGAVPSDNYSTITITATPTSPGAGPSPRSITKLVRIRKNCNHELRAAYLDARSADCIVKNGSVYEVSNAQVRINGLIVKPVDASYPSLVIDPAHKTVKSLIDTMQFGVSVDGSPDVPLYSGPIDWDFSAGDSGPHKVAGFKINGARLLKHLPIAAVDAFFLESGKANVKPALKLDFWPVNHFGAITATTTFTTGNDNGADFSGLEIKLADINALGIKLKSARLVWQQGGTWSGEAKVVLQFAHPYTVDAGFGLKDGDFDFLRASVSGLNIAVSPGVFLQQIGFDVHTHPLVLIGTVGFTGGPSVAGVSAVRVNGALRAVLADPFVIEVTGNAKVADKFDLGSALVRYTSTGLFEFGAKAKFKLWRLSLDGGVDGWVDGLQAFNVEGETKACLDVFGVNPCGDAKVLLSSKGVAGCVGVYGYFVGAGATWDLDFDAFTGCDLAPYREVKPASRSRLHAVSNLTQTVLPKGLPSAAWEVRGNGHVPGPGVTLIGPHGEAVSVSRNVPFVQNGRFRAEMRGDGTTFVLVNKPSAGVWRLSDDGTVPVTRVREARGLPKASVKASVKGHGRTRVLSWKLRPIHGQQITFAEIGKDVRNAITTTSTKRGSVRFKLATGPSGKRHIVALVSQNGRPRTTLTLTSFKAPGPPKPGRPRSLRVRRRGSSLIVSWRPHPRGFRHAVYIVLSDKRRIVRIVPARRHSLRLKGVSARVGAKVVVMGLTPANGKGPAARRKVKPKHR